MVVCKECGTSVQKAGQSGPEPVAATKTSKIDICYIYFVCVWGEGRW